MAYTRKKKSKDSEQLIPEEPRELELEVVLEAGVPRTNLSSKPNNSKQGSEFVDLALPIALRKQPQSCTLHSIQKHVSYKALPKLPSFHH